MDNLRGRHIVDVHFSEDRRRVVFEGDDVMHAYRCADGGVFTSASGRDNLGATVHSVIVDSPNAEGSSSESTLTLETHLGAAVFRFTGSLLEDDGMEIGALVTGDF